MSESLIHTESNTIRQPKTVQWEPHPDITAHEIALAIPALLMLANGRGAWVYVEDHIEALPDNVRRHFVVG